MKSKAKKTGFSIVAVNSTKKSYTIIELLTVMSIIVILMAILSTALSAVRKYAKKVAQKSQFKDITHCLESFYADFGYYPDSSWNDKPDGSGNPYCGAMKLCEAMVGQDGFGLHNDSKFLALDPDGLYYNRKGTVPDPINNAADKENLQNRRDRCLEKAQIAPIKVLLGTAGDFDPCSPVLCDIYKRTSLMVGDEKAGMPVLYYKADPEGMTHDSNEGIIQGTNIYNYLDNCQLLRIKPPWAPAEIHPLYDSSCKSVLFYSITTNRNASMVDDSGKVYAQPHNRDSYILISAGFDGFYGTDDDVFNFED